MNNLERHKDDLEQLINTGEKLIGAMLYMYMPEKFEETFREQLKTSEFLRNLPDNLPDFLDEYQIWYSEAKTLIRQLLPDRLGDFIDHYEKPKVRKDLTYESYRISDYLLGLSVNRGHEAAISRFSQQLAIVKAARNRFESSLFNIRQVVQADLFDSELEAAQALIKYGFFRAAGTIAGVIIEKHLAQVCKNHGIKLRKKSPSIADFNEALKRADVVDVSQWRFNQRLSDIRNLCAHDKGKEPTNEQVTNLVDGVMKLIKTLF